MSLAESLYLGAVHDEEGGGERVGERGGGGEGPGAGFGGGDGEAGAWINDAHGDTLPKPSHKGKRLHGAARPEECAP